MRAQLSLRSARVSEGGDRLVVPVEDGPAAAVARTVAGGEVGPLVVDRHPQLVPHRNAREEVQAGLERQRAVRGEQRLVDVGHVAHDLVVAEAVGDRDAGGADGQLTVEVQVDVRAREQVALGQVVDADVHLFDHRTVAETVADPEGTTDGDAVHPGLVERGRRVHLEARTGAGDPGTVVVDLFQIVVPTRVGPDLDEVLRQRAAVVLAGHRRVVHVGVRDDVVLHPGGDLGAERRVVVQLAPQPDLELVAHWVVPVGAGHRVELGAADVAAAERLDLAVGPGLDQPAEVDDVAGQDLVGREAEAPVAVRLHREGEAGRLQVGDVLQTVEGRGRERPPTHVDGVAGLAVQHVVARHPALEDGALAVVLGGRLAAVGLGVTVLVEHLNHDGRGVLLRDVHVDLDDRRGRLGGAAGDGEEEQGEGTHGVSRGKTRPDVSGLPLDADTVL